MDLFNKLMSYEERNDTMNIYGKNNLNKIKLFTHYDLDGLGCAILGKAIFGESIDISIIDANQSSQIIDDWISTHDLSNYRALFITDLSVNLRVAYNIDGLNLVKSLQDHHDTAKELNSIFNWCRVIDSVDYCGTNLFYNYLLKLTVNEPAIQNKLSQYKRFVYEVHMYDNWLWVDAKDELANDLNLLLKILGKKRFIDRFVEDPSVNLGNDEKALLYLEKERINSYVYSRSKSCRSFKITLNNITYNCIIAFADQYVNELAHELLNTHPDDNVAIIVNLPYTLSFRSRTNEINLTPLTSFLGGGGHPASGGVPINFSELDSIVKLLFDNPDLKIEEVEEETF